MTDLTKPIGEYLKAWAKEIRFVEFHLEYAMYLDAQTVTIRDTATDLNFRITIPAHEEKFAEEILRVRLKEAEQTFLMERGRRYTPRRLPLEYGYKAEKYGGKTFTTLSTDEAEYILPKGKLPTIDKVIAEKNEQTVKKTKEHKERYDKVEGFGQF